MAPVALHPDAKECRAPAKEGLRNVFVQPAGPRAEGELAESGCIGNADGSTPPVIWCFWHRAVIPATYRFRNQGLAVMTSRSFDGEYIARTIEKLGFRAVRGSSTRGGAPALL